MKGKHIGSFQKRHMNRREFLALSLGLAGAGLAASCVPAVPAGQPAPTTNLQPTESLAAVQQPGVEASSTPEPVYNPAKGRRTVIEVQHPFGGTDIAVMFKILQAFEDAHPDIGVRGVWADNDLSTNQKLFTDIAAGNPPTVTWVDGPQVAEWAERSALEPLDTFVTAAGLGEQDFWAPSWRQIQYKNHIWALPSSADANFGFFWNKSLFAAAGLDPEKPPQTIAEVNQYAEKLTKVIDGKVEQMGIIPWNYGSANSMFTWGWVFGGEFFDAANLKITADDPRNVAALQWMVDIGEKYGGVANAASFQTSFGEGEISPFLAGKVAMQIGGSWDIFDLQTYAPDVEYGIARIPCGPPPASCDSGWVGGYCVGMPRGAREPEAGWEFIRWLCATPEATMVYGPEFRMFPGYKRSPYFDVVAKDPQLAVFYDILRNAKHQRPVMPAQGYFMGSLQRNVDAALYGQKTAAQALADATQETQKELDKVLQRG